MAANRWTRRCSHKIVQKSFTRCDLACGTNLAELLDLKILMAYFQKILLLYLHKHHVKWLQNTHMTEWILLYSLNHSPNHWTVRQFVCCLIKKKCPNFIFKTFCELKESPLDEIPRSRLQDKGEVTNVKLLVPAANLAPSCTSHSVNFITVSPAQNFFKLCC